MSFIENHGKMANRTSMHPNYFVRDNIVVDGDIICGALGKVLHVLIL